MRKIKALLNRGWTVDLRKQSGDGWFNVGANHNFWGDVDVWDENLNTAINKMYDEAKKLELE